MACRLGPGHHFRKHRLVSLTIALVQSGGFGLSRPVPPPYICSMNPLATDWPIKRRSDYCHVTQRPFAPGELFYTLLYRDGDGFRREDLSEEAWLNRNENIQPFSFWKTKFEPDVSPPEPLAKENAEALFRRLIVEATAPPHACFILAVMLERKRVLKQIRTEENAGRRMLIYEHSKNGDVFIVEDPKLQLDDLEHVQK